MFFDYIIMNEKNIKKLLTSERDCGIISLPLHKGFFFVR